MQPLFLPDQIFDDMPKAYLVGGSVRDLVRGIEPLDYDIVVPSSPGKFAQELAKRLDGKIVAIGKNEFDVYRIISDTLAVDVSAMKGSEIETDLKARDFTINAMACELSSRKIIDSVGGLADLRNRKIKMITSQVFKTDPARLIRAYRMAATMNFEIEPMTLRTIGRQAGLINQTAGERIWEELKLIMACPHSFWAIKSMSESKLLFYLIPALSELLGCKQNQRHTADVFTHTLQAYNAMENLLCYPNRTLPHAVEPFVLNMTKEKQVLIKMAILLHDTGKPASRSSDDRGQIHFYGHASKSAALSKQVGKRLRMSNRYQNWIEMVVRHHQRPLSLYLAQQHHPLRPKTLGRFLRQCDRYTPFILIHSIADHLGKGRLCNRRNDPIIVFFNNLLSTYFEKSSKTPMQPLIDGNDLINSFKIKPSPLVGKILQSVEELQIAGSLKSRKQALRWVSIHFNLKNHK